MQLIILTFLCTRAAIPVLGQTTTEDSTTQKNDGKESIQGDNTQEKSDQKINELQSEMKETTPETQTQVQDKEGSSTPQNEIQESKKQTEIPENATQKGGNKGDNKEVLMERKGDISKVDSSKDDSNKDERKRQKEEQPKKHETKMELEEDNFHAEEENQPVDEDEMQADSPVTFHYEERSAKGHPYVVVDIPEDMVRLTHRNGGILTFLSKVFPAVFS